ncbi:GntR family transcriptional regulator [Streptomyces gamaensis]|uniref:GntR family transcriptional regulator n=1 Tax=Streptomyces gamaensis TaxID=1763542 RepID=A0ABW0YXE3_9ACTN
MGAPERSATPPPYLRIAAELRARIASGELRAGERVPSTRRISQEWGVATATATKVLAVLRQEGLVRALPGVGTVVDAPGLRAAARRRRDGPPAGAVLTPGRVVRTAVGIADKAGGAAVSMRSVAAELGVSTVALYRAVPGKAQLVSLMVDTVLAEAGVPDHAPGGWRSRLEAMARHQWALCRRHPWLPRALPVTRPPLPPRLLEQWEWGTAPLVRLGLQAPALLSIGATVSGFVRGVAADLGEGGAGFGADLTCDVMFEFGMERLLDGLAVHVARVGC